MTTKCQALIDDPYLEPHAGKINWRNEFFWNRYNQIVNENGSLNNYADKAMNYYGTQVTPEGTWVREWLPHAQDCHVMGDFNGWNRDSHQLKRLDSGVWELFIPHGDNGLKHKQLYKLHIRGANGDVFDRNPAWCRLTHQDENNKLYTAVFWNPQEEYQMKNPVPPRPKNLRIYEAHVGMSSEIGHVSTYEAFTNDVLPRIKNSGYNCVQIMAIQEHAYYGSFGYHVTNFFAASSRYGTIDGLKRLIDTAHG